MSKRQEAKEGEGLLEDILSLIYKRLRKNIVKEIQKYIFDVSKFLFKKIILVIIGAVLIILGVLFTCISLVKYVSIYVPTYLAWLGVGLAVLIIGYLISVITLRR